MYLVTGAAGFIGYHLVERLVTGGEQIVGIDNMNAYYDVRLKEARLARLLKHDNFRFMKMDIADAGGMRDLFAGSQFHTVVHLAAQPGVRYSLVNPQAYVQANVVGFLNVLEACRHTRVGHLVFASSSSVYGANTHMPFSVHDNVDHPLSLYAATKKANEMMAHCYAHLFGLPCTGLRFFTVYGPWGRPDMMPTLFAKAIVEGKPIELFNHGLQKRDFTYVDDIVEGVVRVCRTIPQPNPNWSAEKPDPSRSTAPYRLYNIGNHTPIELIQYVEILERVLGKKAIKKLLPMQPGDVLATYADIDDLVRDTGFSPSTLLGQGIQKFVDWFIDYYRPGK